LDQKEEKIKEIEKAAQKKDFWDDEEKAVKQKKKLSYFKEDIEGWKDIKKRFEDIKEMNKLTENDEELEEELEVKIEKFEEDLKEIETKIYLSSEYDNNDAVLTISSGAGGRDAEDWAAMLFRMYRRYCDKKNFKFNILEQNFGESGGPKGRVGIKKAVVEIKGRYAYGLLKKESGAHRLVRISPFSSQDLRHTSFALVEVVPNLENVAKDIKFDEDELTVQTFRASGPGGQHVNRRETAVRIIHEPTGIKVSCQAERSQARNKEKALRMLKSKIYQERKLKKEKELEEVKENVEAAEWGNQIRSYVMHPYQMVKDLRTEVETSNIDEVLDGEIDQFIKAEIRLPHQK